MANPSNLQIRTGFEANEGYGNPASWIDVRVRSESLGADFPTIADDSIIAFAEEQEGLETKIDPSGDLPVNYSPEDHAKYIAAFFGKGATPAESPTGVWTHKLAPTETGVTFGTLATEVSRDLLDAVGVARPEIYVAQRVKQLTMNAAPRSILNGAISLLTPRFSTWRTGEVVAGGSGTQAIPYARGLLNYVNQTAADGDLYGEITSAPAGGAMSVKWKVGTAGVFGTAIVHTAGAWKDILVTASDVHAGDAGLPVQVAFLAITGSVADVVRIRRNRAVWTQSLPVASALNEIAITTSLDGVPFRCNQVGVTLVRPGERDENIGGRFIDTVVEYGQRTAQYTISRRALDTGMIDRLWKAKSVQFRIDCYGTIIGSTVVRRRLSLISLNCKPMGKGPSVGGAADFPENITLKAHPSTDVTYPSAVTCELVNSQSSLA